MKALLGLLGGFFFSLVIFAAGAGVAVYIVAVPERERGLGSDAAYNWPLETEVVNRAQQDKPMDTTHSVDARVEVAESATTGAVASYLPEEEASLALRDHIDWCTERYRSYRRDDNRYAPYSGGWRQCVSPFSRELSVTAEARESLGERYELDVELIGDDDVDQQWNEASVEFAVGDGLDPDHISSCSRRYRSYRVADNTYQPFGGGPRRHCSRR